MGVRWDRSTSFVKDLGEWAKLGALILAILGFLTIYFPGLKRTWEVNFQPADWYYIGNVDGGRFHPFAYQNPLWNDGPAAEAALNRVPGQVVVTMNDELHIGRRDPGAAGVARKVFGRNVCLYVSEIRELQAPGDPKHDVWAKAVNVTC